MKLRILHSLAPQPSLGLGFHHKIRLNFLEALADNYEIRNWWLNSLDIDLVLKRTMTQKYSELEVHEY
jgi:hypothetical protein